MKQIIGIYLVNILVILGNWYMFNILLNVHISFIGVVIAIIFSIICNFMRVDNLPKNREITLRVVIMFTTLYCIIALILCATSYLKGYNYNFNWLIVVLTIQIIINYFIRFLFFKKLVDKM